MNSEIDRIILELGLLKTGLKVKAHQLVKALAEMGCEVVNMVYDETSYAGPTDTSVKVVQTGPLKFEIQARGATVLFLEFGAGVTYNSTLHPMAAELGYGPTTYPGQTHAADPKGWYLPKSAAGRSGIHTYGTPASAAMYRTGKELKTMVTEVAQEVFGG